ncbi:phage/plasmid primase, P4 family [Paenibacillus larvae subsp. larvae DSM 25719]|nr:phage/plasmid primase, P4 family [Paenibacillus larvae subsp. larvae DSM 25719]
MGEKVTELYKGFIQTKNKKPLKEYKDGSNFISYEWARKLPEYAGILAEDIILVDVDDMDTSDTLLQIVDDLAIPCFVVDTTRGKHFLFRNSEVSTNKTKTKTAVGIQVDMKLGSRNSYQILKHNGVARKWIRKCELPDELPRWLLPVKTNVDFNALGEGDGRNQALFNYILTLQSAGLSKDEIRETIGLINKYVVSEPLEDKEIDVILRDEAFKKKSFYKRGEFLHHEFAKYIRQENHVMKLNNVLHVYKDGVYSGKQQDVESAMIQHLPQLTAAKRKETTAYLELIVEKMNSAPVNLIALENGIYNLEDDTLDEFSPDIIIKNKIPVTYDPDVYDEATDKVLDKISCHDAELRALLEEMIGYLLLRRNELGKCFILTGSGSNGKSTLLDMLKNFLGPENYSSLSLDEIGHRFKTAEVFGKLANLGDDISSQYIDNNAVFKKLVTGETVNVERKGKDPFEFNNYAKLIFSANQLPRINDTTDGLMRRLIIIPFNAKFSSADADFDPFIKDKLLTDNAMKYLLQIALKGLKRVLSNKRFTMPDIIKRELAEYEKMNNPVMAFIDEGRKVENETTKEVYLSYSAWCYENGLRPLSQIQFSREMCKHGFITKLKKISGKPVRIFGVTDSNR